jgi:hypothetical protein
MEVIITHDLVDSTEWPRCLAGNGRVAVHSRREQRATDGHIRARLEAEERVLSLQIV